MASVGALAYSGRGSGHWAEPPMGPRGKAPGQGTIGGKSPEADDSFIIDLYNI